MKNRRKVKGERQEKQAKEMRFKINNTEKEEVVKKIKRALAETWEDFYDALVAKQRENEPRESIDSVTERFRIDGYRGKS